MTFKAKRLIVYVRIHNGMKTEQAIKWLDDNLRPGWRDRE